MKLKSLILLFALFVLTGCATVNRGTNDYFRIDSVPQGATATSSIETLKSKRARAKDKTKTPVYKGCAPTPCAIKLPRNSEFTVRLEHQNYEPVEMYVTNSYKRGSLTANTAATVVGTAGTAVGTAAAAATVTAGVAGATGAFTGGLLAGTGASFTFGLVSVETAIATGVQSGLNAGLATAPSTSSAIGAAIPPALAVTAGMLLIDAGTGANKNFYPNPVVLQLAPKGSAVKTDPLVTLFKEQLIAQEHADELCGIIQKKHTLKYRQPCYAARADLKAKKAALKAVRKSYTTQAETR